MVHESEVPPDTEAEGATTSPTLYLLKTRSVHVSSSSVSTTTTPFCLSTAGAGSIGWGAEVAEVGGAMDVEVPTPAMAVLHLASWSANFFFVLIEAHIYT